MEGGVGLRRKNGAALRLLSTTRSDHVPRSAPALPLFSKAGIAPVPPQHLEQRLRNLKRKDRVEKKD